MKSAEYLYRPQHKHRDELINDFVIRNKLYDRVLDSIKSEVLDEPSQHILIEGKRGMGKTTLMLRLTYELQNEKNLKERFVPCKFNEEEYGVANLAILWERIAEHLEEDERFDGVLEMFDEIEGDDGEEQFIEEILKWLEDKKVMAVVFIDNFFQIIEKFPEREQQRLREVLIKTPYLKIVAGSARFLERNTGDYAAPFFEFFKREKLDKLSPTETKELLLHLAQKHTAQQVIDTINNEPHRIDNIRILCGGVPRTLVTFFEVLMDDVDGNSIEDLKHVMDRVNELYLQRMNSLSKKEQRIIHTMALHWEAISTGELAAKIGEESKAISSILNKLTKQQIIEKLKTDTKNHLYRIEERFFNIWYLLTQAPRRYQRKVKWLTAFIESIYSGDDFNKRLEAHILYLENGKMSPEYAIMITNALSHSQMISIHDRDKLLLKTKEILEGFDKEFTRSLPMTMFEVLVGVMRKIQEGRIDLALKLVSDYPQDGYREMMKQFVKSYKLEPAPDGLSEIEIFNDAIERTKGGVILAEYVSKEINKSTSTEVGGNSVLADFGMSGYDLHRSIAMYLSSDSELNGLEAGILILMAEAKGKVFIMIGESLIDRGIYVGYALKAQGLNLNREYDAALANADLALTSENDVDRHSGILAKIRIMLAKGDGMALLQLLLKHLDIMKDVFEDYSDSDLRAMKLVVCVFLSEFSEANNILDMLLREDEPNNELIDFAFKAIFAAGQSTFLHKALASNKAMVRNKYLPYYYLHIRNNNLGSLVKMPPELEEPLNKLEAQINDWSLIINEGKV